MISHWRIPLPLEEYTTSRVVVYSYSGRWIPIMFYPLVDAIELYRKARNLEKEILVFPPDLNPHDFQYSPEPTVLEPSRALKHSTVLERV